MLSALRIKFYIKMCENYEVRMKSYEYFKRYGLSEFRDYSLIQDYIMEPSTTTPPIISLIDVQEYICKLKNLEFNGHYFSENYWKYIKL